MTPGAVTALSFTWDFGGYVRSLGGLQHELGFHFAPGTDEYEARGKELEAYCKSIKAIIIKKIPLPRHLKTQRGLMRLEFFRTEYPQDLKESFDEFQKFFENIFGAPSRSKKDPAGFWNHEWSFKKVQISHFVRERFMLEERLTISRA